MSQAMVDELARVLESLADSPSPADLRPSRQTTPQPQDGLKFAVPQPRPHTEHDEPTEQIAACIARPERAPRRMPRRGRLLYLALSPLLFMMGLIVLLPGAWGAAFMLGHELLPLPLDQPRQYAQFVMFLCPVAVLFFGASLTLLFKAALR